METKSVLHRDLGFFETFDEILKELFQGARPSLIDKRILTHHNRGIHKLQITLAIEQILKAHPKANFKFGKSGHPFDRGNYDDYRGKYDKMFVLYQTMDRNVISDLESYYITKYFRKHRNDNQTKHSAGPTTSRDGYYYLYMVLKSN